MTPMEEQYYKIKSEYPDYIILFRLGDFYEAFEQDAITLSKILGITLTSRGKSEDKKPMAGVPHHSLSNYLPKIIKAKLKVAIADQVEEAVPGKLVERQVTKLITPGSLMDEKTLDESTNNYALSFLQNVENYTMSYADLSTGQLYYLETTDPKTCYSQIMKINPAEIITDESSFATLKNWGIENATLLDDYYFEKLRSETIVKKQFGESVIFKDQMLPTTASVLLYLSETQRAELKHFKKLEVVNLEKYMKLDPETIRNLELVSTMYDFDSDQYTVYNCLNDCKTAMGQRKLKSWLLSPLIDYEDIKERYDNVEVFYIDRIFTAEVREQLSEIYDLERLVSKLGVGSINPKELRTLVNSLKYALNIVQLYLQNDQLPDIVSNQVKFVKENFVPNVEKFIEKVDENILPEPAISTTDGPVIVSGISEELDSLRSLKKDAKQILNEMQIKQAEDTGITNLKIGFNKVFGYYIEVTKSHLDKVPNNYIRKQTLANAERYITEELKTLEEKILNSEVRIYEIETELYASLLENLRNQVESVLDMSGFISSVDVYANLGNISRDRSYVRPNLSKEDKRLEIVDGRHPVVDILVDKYTSNSCSFTDNSRIQIITGPNMSGKSTFIRQVALLTILAQVGCFVPAKSMDFGVVDRVFTRVGASDNLAKGESTFMVEMKETANILNNATENSLIILDEVGRGTSTYDGVAIAWSILEFLATGIKAKTLFATHYHELTALNQKFTNVKNLNVSVHDDGSEITFLHKIEEGIASKSYGVHVAKLAGVPEDVVKRAEEILKSFEEGNINQKASNKSVSNSNKKTPKPKTVNPEQLRLI